jgi:hypothetical protein
MSRHLADKRKPSDGGRMKHFLRLARDGGTVWRSLWQRPAPGATNRRVVEYVRIARGRSV